MQAYAKAGLAPAKLEVNHQLSRHSMLETEVAANAELGARWSASSALAGVLLDGLDDDAARALAKRLAPHLRGLEDVNPAHAAYTVHSLAAALGVSQKAIRCAISRGELYAVKRGSRWIISADAVADWATARERRRTRPHGRPARAPKAAGPSLRSTLCGGGGR
jgi:excisionase family DNA binding protein